MNWDDLRLLIAVARHGSFLQAGQKLGLAPSTLSRRLTRLEEEVGQPLIERNPEGIRLTSRGKQVLVVAEMVEREIQRQAPQPGEQDVSGTVSISTSDGFIPIVLESVQDYLVAFPHCSVEFSVEREVRQIGKLGVDLAIRTVNLGEASLIYKKLVSIEFGIYARQDLAERLGPSPSAGNVELIQLLPPLDQLAHVRAAQAHGFSRSRFRVSSFQAQLEAARCGLGAAVLPRALASIDLVEPFGRINLPVQDIFLVTRPALLRQPHIRQFVDCLYAAFERQIAAAKLTNNDI